MTASERSHPPPAGSIGLWGAVAIGIGGMVGGGIFAVLGLVVEQAGGGAPLAFVLAGVVALLTASSYAKLSVAYPSQGGSVVFVDRVFGVRVATGSLNNLLWFGYLVTLALYATAFAGYAVALVGTDGTSSPWMHRLLIVAAIGVPTALNLLSSAIVAETETTIVGIKLAMLAVVVTAGMTTVQWTTLEPATWPSIPAIAAAGMLVFVAYEGFELIANAGAEVTDPARTLPRALFTSVGLVVFLYVAVAVVTTGSLSPQKIAASADFALAEAARPSLGTTGFLIVSISALLATLSAINATLYGTARLSYSIAREGELPPLLERKVWTEPIGLLITAGASLVLALSFDVGAISSIASSVFLLVFGAVNSAAARAAPSRGAAILAGAGVLACVTALAVLLVNTAGERPVALLVSVGMVAAAVAGEWMWLGRRRTLRLGGND